MKKTFIISIILLLSSSLYAQNVSDLIISEIMADGDSSITDDYGRKVGWIEIFNKSRGTVNYGGCFLTDDKSDLKKSLIPKGDARTKIGARQSVIFFASGRGEDGTYYTNFQIRRGSTIYLVSNDGKTIIDELSVPKNLPTGKSVIKLAEDNKQLDFETVSVPAIPSPGMMNGSINEESGSNRIAREDPHGWILTIVSISVVFLSLTILWILFNRLFQPKEKKNKKIAKGSNITPETAAAISMAIDMECGGERYAAIALALDRFLNKTIHDNESFIITIKQPYHASNWNDKSLSFRKLPNIKNK